MDQAEAERKAEEQKAAELVRKRRQSVIASRLRRRGRESTILGGATTLG
jgi:hypothetical protein